MFILSSGTCTLQHNTNRKSSLIPFYLAYLNKKHEKRRIELGKSGQITDESMMRKPKLEESKSVDLVEDVGNHAINVDGDNGLHDVTDLKNEDFIYVY